PVISTTRLRPLAALGYICGRIPGGIPPPDLMKALIRAGFILFSSVLMGGAMAQQGGQAHEGADTHAHQAPAKFNPGAMIMGHVGDEHGWHLFGHTSIPLPILAYNTQRGFT